MDPQREVEYVLHDCFFAVGQIVGTAKRVDADALAWWRQRYREKFLCAIGTGNSWLGDRDRLTAVGRFLALRALHHAATRPSIDLECARRASLEVEAGCRMNAIRERQVTV